MATADDLDITVPFMRLREPTIRQTHILAVTDERLNRLEIGSLSLSPMTRASFTLTANSIFTGYADLATPGGETVEHAVRAVNIFSGASVLESPPLTTVDPIDYIYVTPDDCETGLPALGSPSGVVVVRLVTPDNIFSGYADLGSPTLTESPLFLVTPANASTGYAILPQPAVAASATIVVNPNNLSTGLPQLAGLPLELPGIRVSDISTGAARAGKAFYKFEDTHVTQTLPFIPLLESAVATPVAGAAVQFTAPGGPPRSRKDISGVRVYAPAAWSLVGTEYDEFMTFFAANKHHQFVVQAWSPSEGYTAHLCRYVYGTLQVENSGEVYRVAATLELVEGSVE